MRDVEDPDTGIPRGARFFDETFRAHETGWFFGDEPSALARRVRHFFRRLEMPTAGRLLDLGCGEGRDTAFFASLGFDVEAVDGSPTAIERTRIALATAGLGAEVSERDIADFPWEGEYDVIFANNSIQFMGDEALKLIEVVRSKTKPGGFNAIGMFTREAVDWRREPETYCLEPRELRHIYRSWTLLEYSESIVFSPRRGHYLSFAYLIGRRPER